MTHSLDYSPKDFEQILQETTKIIQKQYENLEFLKGFNSVPQPEVAAWFDEPLPLLGMDYSHLLAETKQKVMDTATGNLGHNMYAYVMSGGNQISTVAELLMSTVNQNNAKWHLAPAMAEIEQRVVKWAAEMIHFTPEPCPIQQIRAGNPWKAMRSCAIFIHRCMLSFSGNNSIITSTNIDNTIPDIYTNYNTLMMGLRIIKFSIYDIDVRQNVTITAKDISGTAINITTLAKANILSTITIAGSGTTSASATSQFISLDIANNSDLATVNVTINGPVKTVILTFTKNNTTADPIWISDISANVVGSWPTNYQTVSTPEAGQHSYVIANKHNKILVLDLNDTTTSVLYTDAAFQRINSIAYDPYKQVVYYCDQYAINTNKTVYKYDVKTGVKSVAIADITTLGVVLESGGVGSGGGSFYNGSLFLGIDANTGLGEAAAIWRIDFNSSGVATKASRFWGVYANDSIAAATYLYNWGDYVINNGILYNFNVGYAAVANTQAQHIDMNTQKYIANYSTSRVWQTGIDYAGNIYNIGNDSIAVYNAGVLSGKRKVRSYVAGDSTFDAAESFKYPYDFGDAPTSYGTPFHLYNTSPKLKPPPRRAHCPAPPRRPR